MPARVVVDSGPLYAYIDRRDAHHLAAVSFLQGFRGELLSTLAVITEVMYLLDFSIDAQLDFLTWLRNGAITIIDITHDDLNGIIGLMSKFASRPMDFADASLVTIADRLGIRHVASVDDDFLIYRYKGRHPFRNVFHADD